MKLEEQFKVYIDTYALKEYSKKIKFDDGYGKIFLYNKNKNKVTRYKDSNEDVPILPIISWFIESDNYGKMIIHDSNCFSNESHGKLFNYYGCGMEWFGSNKRKILTLGEAKKYGSIYNYLKTELDEIDFEYFKKKFNIFLYCDLDQIDKYEEIPRRIWLGDIDSISYDINKRLNDYPLEEILNLIKRKTTFKDIKTSYEYLHMKTTENQRGNIIKAINTGNTEELLKVINEIITEFEQNDNQNLKIHSKTKESNVEYSEV